MKNRWVKGVHHSPWKQVFAVSNFTWKFIWKADQTTFLLHYAYHCFQGFFFIKGTCLPSLTINYGEGGGLFEAECKPQSQIP